MGIFKLEHSRGAYRADFALYGAAVAMLAAILLLGTPDTQGLAVAALALLGLCSWTVIEYAFHRFILHGMPPFRRWHAVHHARPLALICTPTILSATLIAALVFLPALLLGNPWQAAGVTLGVLIGYLFYGITHHATHHWRANHPWLQQRKRWHALHHHAGGRPGYYGVTSTFWDRVLGSVPTRASPGSILPCSIPATARAQHGRGLARTGSHGAATAKQG